MQKAEESTPRLEVEYMPVTELVPYENNSKRHPDRQIGEIAASIERFGDVDPIAVWHDDEGRPVIVEGHGRALALQRLGVETAPVIVLDHLSNAERRAYSHVHNQTTLSSGLDAEVLGADMADLPEFDWEAFGFDPIETDEPVEIPDAPLPENVETRVQPGELWRMGVHYLLCGDSSESGAISGLLDAMGATEADLLLTDPPYNVGLGYHETPEDAKARHRRTDGKVVSNDEFRDGEAYVEFLTDVLTPAVSALRAGGSYYVWHASTEDANVVRALEAVGLPLRQILVWVKNVFTFGRQDYQWRHELCAYGWRPGASHRFYAGRNVSTIFEDDEPDLEAMTKDDLVALIRDAPTDVLRFARPTRSPEHPTMKPVPLFARLVSNSTRPGEVVLDPFAGTGTTALACEHLGRRAALVELDPGFCDATLARWEELTGSKAERVRQ